MESFPYLDALIKGQRIDQLTAAWSTVKKMNPTKMREGALDANLIYNGDFASEILNGGLDWRINPQPGAVIRIDNATFHNGISSLRIQFDGKQNLSDALVFQYVPVTPNTSYHFEGYMRTQGITTDSGPRFQIRDADDPTKLFLESDDMLGNSSWIRRQLDFKSSRGTHLLEIRVTRLPSTKFDNRIAGTAWVDQVALTVVKPETATGFVSGGIYEHAP